MSDAAFGRGKRSRSAAGYTKPLPSFEGASQGKDPLQRLAMDKSLDGRLKAVETKTGTGTFSSDKQSPVTAPPARAQAAVANAGTNFISVAITNPEYLDPKNNPSRTPVIHKVETSPVPDFSRNVKPLPPSTQTHYVLPTGGAAVYVKFSSSLDGVNFNQAQVSGPHQ